MAVRVRGEGGHGKRLICGCCVPLEWTLYANHHSVVRVVFPIPLAWEFCCWETGVVYTETGRTLPVWWEAFNHLSL